MTEVLRPRGGGGGGALNDTRSTKWAAEKQSAIYTVFWGYIHSDVTAISLELKNGDSLLYLL